MIPRDKIDYCIQNNNNPETFLAIDSPQDFAARRIRILKQHFPPKPTTNYNERLIQIRESLHQFNRDRNMIIADGERLEQWNLPHNRNSNVSLKEEQLLNQATKVIESMNNNIAVMEEEKQEVERKKEPPFENKSLFGPTGNSGLFQSVPEAKSSLPLIPQESEEKKKEAPLLNKNPFAVAERSTGLFPSVPQTKSIFTPSPSGHQIGLFPTVPDTKSIFAPTHVGHPITLFPALPETKSLFPPVDHATNLFPALPETKNTHSLFPSQKSNESQKSSSNNSALFPPTNQGLFDNFKHQPAQPAQPAQPTLQTVQPTEPKTFNDSSFLFKKPLSPVAPEKKPQLSSIFQQNQITKPEPVQTKPEPVADKPFFKGLFSNQDDNKIIKNSTPLLFNNDQNSTQKPKITFNLKPTEKVNTDIDIKDILKNPITTGPSGLFNNAVVTTPVEPPKAQTKQIVNSIFKPQVEAKPEEPAGLFSKPNSSLFANNNNGGSLFSQPKPTESLFGPAPVVETVEKTPAQATPLPSIFTAPPIQPPKIQTKPHQVVFPKLQTNSEIIKEKSLFTDSNPLPKTDKAPVPSNVSLFSTPSQSLFAPSQGGLFGSSSNTPSLFGAAPSGGSLFGGSQGNNMFMQGANIFNQPQPQKQVDEQNEGQGQDSDGLVVDSEPQVQEGKMQYEYKSQMTVIIKFNAQLFKRNQQESIKHVIVSLQKSNSADKVYLFIRSKQTKRVVYTGIIIAATVCTLMSNKTNARFTPVLYINPADSKPTMDIIRIKFNEVANSEAFEKAMKTHQG